MVLVPARLAVRRAEAQRARVEACAKHHDARWLATRRPQLSLDLPVEVGRAHCDVGVMEARVKVGQRRRDHEPREVRQHRKGRAAVARALKTTVARNSLEPHNDQVDARVGGRCTVPAV